MSLHSPQDEQLEEFKKHQEDILPFTSKYIGAKNLDIGCGNGLTSVIHKQELGISPTLCDVVDIRHDFAKDLPFFILDNNSLPYEENVFDSSYMQYVLHHLQEKKDSLFLLNEASRVSRIVIIVEEIKGENTDIEKALKFDREVNSKIYPKVHMPVYQYYSEEEMRKHICHAGMQVLDHSVISKGDEKNGYLETHVFVGTKS